MEEKQSTIKQPMHKKTIFKVMVYLTFIVSAVFLVKNIVAKSVQGIVVIGASLAAFAIILLIMKVMRAKNSTKEFVVSIALLFVVFLISSSSGASYSDDFAMYLAVIALSGMFLRPKYTLVQTILSDILLVILAIINPEKAGGVSQFILCLATFTLAAVLFYMVIKRGRAFITRSEVRAVETETLLKTITEMGEILQKKADNSLGKVEILQKTNSHFDENVHVLRAGSNSVIQGADDVAQTCSSVHEKIQVTEKQIGDLNGEVKVFEEALADNNRNMHEMNEQMEIVKATMKSAKEVFYMLGKQMQEICKVTEQLNSISSSTNMLALNASIEAARAGQMGAGFAVVASKVQDLAVDSNRCSEQVVKVVALMQKQIEQTTEQMEDSATAIDGSLDTLVGLQDSFNNLTEQFDNLYNNIEEQNHNIEEVDSIFEQLKEKISEMNSFSEENQASVESIAQNMLDYREHVKEVIADTRHVHALSVDMMNYSREQESDTETEK